ncbi:hypothetical protein PGT21_029146 [Puccinia graminis f. sp. tritici]|uniref:Uncharacterized protein n=1 Tax=Puccinia graminis f. sp. tritici TaxID=56615 RepID=A0A5B0QVG6_PUCGR|nr:hypothetical protein PGT21_029146 [Puccinia graminis f. sp. tritici]KAA1116905.1 hypothetical protein PGTUg99_029508 [Puccinia graminis f. sp. tritici]
MSQLYNSPLQSPASLAPHPGERLASSKVPLSRSGSGRGSSRAPQGSGTQGYVCTPQGSGTQQSSRAPQVSGTAANSSRAKGSTAASCACQQDLNDTSEVGWGAPPVPVIDPLLDWAEDPRELPPPESFIGAGYETGFEHKSKTRSSSDEERLPDLLIFTWDAAPAVPNLDQAARGDLVNQFQAQLNFSESSCALANRLFAVSPLPPHPNLHDGGPQN